MKRSHSTDVEGDTSPSTGREFVGQMRRLGDVMQGERSLPRLAALAIVVFAGFSLASPAYYLSVINLQGIAFSVPAVALLSLGVMLTMLTGGIDLSVVSMANLSALTVAVLFNTVDPASHSVGLTLALVLLGILVGAVAGAFNSLLIGVVGVTPILATLGTMLLYNGIAVAWTKGATLFGMPESFLALGNDTVAGIPISFLLLLIVIAVLGVLINRTPIGFKLRFLGANSTAARYSGISIGRALVVTYVTSGALSGLAGVLMASRAASASADYGASFLLLAIVIAVLGGTNPAGGYATVLGVVLAATTLQMLSSGFNILRLTAFQYVIAQGVILIAVLVYEVSRARRRARGDGGAPPAPVGVGGTDQSAGQ